MVNSGICIFVLQVSAAKPSAEIINMAISSWSFLLTTMDERSLNPRSWQELVFISHNIFFIFIFEVYITTCSV